jgi:hypothetical protein
VTTKKAGEKKKAIILSDRMDARAPCRICDDFEPRLTAFRCEVCGYPICEEHRTSQHCEDCYP